jgi:hypothetical protein
MKDERDPTSGKAATSELEPETRHEHGEPRHTTAGLGIYDRVSSIAGTTGFGLAPGVGIVGERPGAMDTVTPEITGVDLDYREGQAGTTHETRFTDEHETRFTDEEDAYWRANYPSRPYARGDRHYDEYRPAYQYGTDAAHRYRGRPWDEVERDLERGWDEARADSRLTWQESKKAVCDAWHRVERALPGDADYNGR